MFCFSKHFESFEAYSVFKFNGSDVANKKEQLNLVQNASGQTKPSINAIKFALNFLSFHNKKQALLTRSSKPRSTFSKETPEFTKFSKLFKSFEACCVFKSDVANKN